VVDIVFIHGLGGGSRKTWSYSSDPDHFWPSWLVTDSEFVDVRLHTFGYNADWSERGQNVFDIHSFGQLLLSSLRNHPDIRRSATRIILVGHSMGGCVAKQAYLLARHDPSAKDIADRIHSFFFLATPHQGSDMATMLENMLSITIGKKPYVTDLAPNSVALKTINDEFRLVVGGLRLVSFYETRPMRVAGLNRFVVDTTSAQLGLPNEEIIPLNADHRHVCKFANREDPNFQLIRNSLITAVDSIKDAVPGTLNHYVDTRIFKQQSSGVSFSPKEQHLTPSEALILRSFLNVAGPIDSEFETLRLLRQPNSCEWFTYRNTFQSWISGRSTAGVLWLVGKPAAGKSIMSTHVIEYLQQSNLNCSFFFCKHSETGGSMLSSIFLSLAYQMALQDRLVRDSILQLAQSDLIWDKTEEISVWKQLFVNCIFKLQSLDQHFWVIDAIDECPNFNVLFTKKLLATLPSSLRLFATSRKMDEIERGLQGSLGPSRVEIYELQDTDTWDDIRLFVNTRLTDLGLSENDEDRERMCEKILKKSFGSFLWARLVLEELETIWTEEDIDTVLDNIPGNLFEYYARMVRSIVEDKRKIGLASTILTWVVLARRPLTIEELICAVKLDLGQTPLLARAKTALPSLCGQLVFVDKYNKVHLIHETVREFLTKHDMLAQELFMRQKNGHTRLGLLLIQYLSGPVLKLNPLSHLAPFKVQLHGSSTSGRALPKQQSSGVSADSALLDYASVFFSDHLLHAMSEDHELMQALFNFLQSSNVLSWIEHVAKLKDLKPLTQTAMNLRNYLARRVKYVAPTDRAIQFADDWVTDLIRVPAKFCDQLLACPSAIQTLIPPLCPPHSAISRTFGSDARNLVVRGLRPGSWDDCLTYLDFVKGRPTSVSHGDHIFAVGLSTGEIWLYDYNTMQCLRTMKHPERVKILEFSTESTLLASAGPKQLSIWDPKSGALLQLFDFPPRCSPLAVVFLRTQEILAAFESKVLIKWYVDIC
jgi:Predicted acetyltransferases and hydrolases with the alpha/beta hydrolase fold